MHAIHDGQVQRNLPGNPNLIFSPFHLPCCSMLQLHLHRIFQRAHPELPWIDVTYYPSLELFKSSRGFVPLGDGCCHVLPFMFNHENGQEATGTSRFRKPLLYLLWRIFLTYTHRHICVIHHIIYIYVHLSVFIDLSLGYIHCHTCTLRDLAASPVIHDSCVFWAEQGTEGIWLVKVLDHPKLWASRWKHRLHHRKNCKRHAGKWPA